MTGIVVEKGSLKGIIEGIELIKKNGKIFYSKYCRSRIEKEFNKKQNFKKYITLYKEILKTPN